MVAMTLMIFTLEIELLLYLLLIRQLTVKIIGNQWYWSYEFASLKSFDSFLIFDDGLNIADNRLLTVDNSLILPINLSIRLLITSNDVIHSFALPELAIKTDAIPGRLNSTFIIINRPSIFYGQCSELCGVLHGFMPIQINGSSGSNSCISS